jgi:hypothetical protein
LLAEDRKDHHCEKWCGRQAQQNCRAKIKAPEREAKKIALNEAKSLDKANHHLGAGKQRASQPERYPLERMKASTNEILYDNLIAAGRQDGCKSLGNVANRVVKVSGATEDAKEKQQYREKSEKHVEGYGLAQCDAVGKDTSQPTQCVLQNSHHSSARRIIREAGDGALFFNG